MRSAVDTDKTRVVGTDRDERLLNAFFVVYKNARIVEVTNKAYVRQCRSFYDQLRSFLDSDCEVVIKSLRGRYFVGERFINYDDNSGAGASITSDWQELGLGGVRFDTVVSPEDIERFFAYMATVSPRAVEDLEELQHDLDLHVPAGIDLLALPEEEDDDNELDDLQRRKLLRVEARSRFFRAVSTVEELMSHAEAEREINLAKTRRVVHSLIDHISRDRDSLMELAAIKDFDDYTYAHSINVSVYALTLGIRLGLERSRLSQLGFSALFHDVGKVTLDQDLIRKPDSFDEYDWMQMQQHPLLGAKTILRNLKLDIHTARAARAAFEHHINDDFTGYPTLKNGPQPTNLFSKIVAIADTFDAMTSGRIYLKRAIPPDKVIKKMRYQMVNKFDSFLLRVFNDVIGIYPAGTLVLLSTDEIAVVVGTNELAFDRPYVRVVGDRTGLLAESRWMDLSTAEYDDVRIVRLVEAERYGLKVRDFVLSDD